MHVVRSVLALLALAAVVYVAYDRFFPNSTSIPGGPKLAWHDAQPASSPDGRLLAFVRGRKWFSLHVVDTRTHVVRRVTPYERHVSDIQPTWSPDGHAIAFIRKGDLYRVNADGTNLVRLTHAARPGRLVFYRSPEWLADGTIAVWRSPHFRIVDPERRYERLLEGIPQERVGGQEYDAAVSFSPNARWLVTRTEARGLELRRRDGRRLRMLDSRRGIGAVAWSPDSAKLAVTRGGEFYVIRTDGRGRRRLPYPAGEYEAVKDPLWSPDGTLIAFIVVNPNLGIAYRWLHRVYVVAADGRDLRRVDIPMPPEHELSYTWARDSRHLVLGGNLVDVSHTDPADPYPLILVDVKTSRLRRLTQTEQESD